MDIALLNERVTFQKHEVVTDEIGNHINTWADYYSCACTISGEGGAESYQAGTVNDHTGMDITVRWCDKTKDITITEFRALFHDQVYNIESVDHMNYKKKCLKFRCSKEDRSG